MPAFIEGGGVQVFPFDIRRLSAMRGWMRRYSEPGKREMELADASLYWVARRLASPTS